jgi:hypothetical protein
MGLFRRLKKIGRGLLKFVDGLITLAVVIAAVAVTAAVLTFGFAVIAGVVIGLGAAAPLAIGITAGVFAIGAMATKSGIKNHAGSSVKCKPIFTFPPPKQLQQQQQQDDDESPSNQPQQSTSNNFKKAATKKNVASNNNAANDTEGSGHRMWAQSRRAGENPGPEPIYSM